MSQPDPYPPEVHAAATARPSVYRLYDALRAALMTRHALSDAQARAELVVVWPFILAQVPPTEPPHDQHPAPTA